jgi:hypothetical protein
MSLVLSGSTSGSVTLQEPAVAGTTVLDLPATSGTVVVTGTTPTLNGITFPATAVPSADANTLDDYEEGTFTPVFRDGISGTAATGTAEGRYTKIGRVVTYQIFFLNVVTTGLTAGNNVHITGLPFTTIALGSGEMNAIACVNSGTPTSGCVTLNLGASRTYGILANQTTSGQTGFTVSQATSGSFDLFIAGSYFAS